MKSSVFFFILFSVFATPSFAQNGGYALKFNGTDGKASMTMNTGNTNSTATLEFWFTQLSTQAGTQYLADLRSISGTNNRRVMPYLNSTVIGIFCAPNTGDDNNAVTQSSGVTVSTNVWYHVAVTINGSTIKQYINGKLYVTDSLTDLYALTGTEVLTLATDYSNTTYANIKMDEVRVWSIDRTEAQIKANMFRELAGNEANLLSYYKMSDGAGASLSDNQVAGTYDGTLAGGYAWVASAAFADSRQALDFDGSDDYVDCGNGVSVQRNGAVPVSVEAWVKPSGGVWGAVISKFVHTAANEGYSLEIFSDNRVAFLFGNNWSDWCNITSNSALTAGVWSHIAATYDGVTAKVYINGRLDASGSWTNGITDSGTNLVIGRRTTSTYFPGQIDEARVWTVARTETQIREAMCRPLVGNEAGLAAYYRLDEIDGVSVYDVTANANTGTMTNMDPATDRVASSAFTTWIGGESTNWATIGNWSKGAVPIAANSVGIFKWALGNEATVSGAPTVNNVLVSSSSSPTLSSALTITGNLILEKNFNLNGQTVTLGSTAYLLEGTGKLYGTSGTISTTRALSNISALDVALLGAKITTAANMGNTTITRGHAEQTGNGNKSILRYYDIAPTNNAGLNATLVFNYLDAELNGLTEANFNLYKSIDGGTTWTNQGGVLTAASNIITKAAIPSFSRWTISDLAAFGNAPPTGANSSINIVQNTTYTFTAGNFTFNDGDGDTFAGIKIETLETAGTLKYNGADVTVGMDCPDVTKLTFTPAADAIGTPYANFTYKLKDSFGTYSAAAYTMTINVAPPPIPTLNEWGMIILALLLCGTAAIRLRRGAENARA